MSNNLKWREAKPKDAPILMPGGGYMIVFGSKLETWVDFTGTKRLAERTARQKIEFGGHSLFVPFTK